MDYFKGDRKYRSLGDSRRDDYELHNTEYGGSPEMIHGTPEPTYGFQNYEDNVPLTGIEKVPRRPSDGSVITKLRSRLPSLQDLKSVRSRLETHSGRPQTIKSWISFWVSMILTLLWCAPAIALLLINGTGWIIGASTWCPHGYCPGIPTDPNQTIAQLTDRYDHQNHNLLGFLQFVAKAMEVWFVFVAVGLVYLVTMLLARSEHGIPIGYLLTYVEFSDLLNFFNFWSSAGLVDKLDPYKKKKRVTRFYIYAGFVAFMCVITNLMGPCVAVLMIPTLQWRTTDELYQQRFRGLDSAAPPEGDNAIPGCNAGDLTEGNYTCNYWVYAYSLDGLVNFMLAQSSQNILIPDNENVVNYNEAASQELALNLRFNVTSLNSSSSDESVYWAPNRQTIRQLSTDIEDWNTSNDTNSRYSQYQNSLSISLQRQGPVVGMRYEMWGGNLRVTQVDKDRRIRCYYDWSEIDDTHPVAKCQREGVGWNSSNALNSFSVGTLASGQPDPDAAVIITNAYFSDKAAFVVLDYSSDDPFPQCLPNGTVPSNVVCDFDKMFSDPPPAGLKPNITSLASNALILEHQLEGDPDLTMMMEAYMSVGVALYTTDVSNASYSASFGDVDIDQFPDQTNPIIVDSAWYLAAWSVNNGGDIPWIRESGRQLQITMTAIYNTIADIGYANYSSGDNWYWRHLQTNALLQTASMLSWSYTDPSTDGLNLAQNDQYEPQLYNNVRRQVWAYGLDSRTSILGVVVLSIGILSAMARTVLSIFTRIKHRSPVEVLVAALKHEPRREFDAAGHSERKMAKIRFEIQDDVHDEIFFTKR